MLDLFSKKNKSNNIFSSDLAKQKGLKSAENAALLKIASILITQNRADGIWNHIAQEALPFLKGDRFTIYTWDEGKESLDIEHTSVSDPEYENIGMAGEKEIALKSKNLKNPFLLAEPKDISQLLKFKEQKTEVTSFIGVPLIHHNQPIRMLCSSKIGKSTGFRKEDLDFLSILGSLALIAVKIDLLSKRADEGTALCNQYERYLDSILAQLQSLFKFEKNIMEEHISSLVSIQGNDNTQVPASPISGITEKESPIPPFKGDAYRERRAAERVNVAVQVDFKNDFIGISNNLSVGGAFIEIPSPLDLQEICDLRIHLPDGAEPIEAKCQVVWSNKYGKETERLRRGMGVKFQNLHPEAQKRIQEFIRGDNSILKGEIEFAREEYEVQKMGNQLVK